MAENDPATETTRRHRWFPTLDLEPGMMLARPVVSGTGLHANMHLAAGIELTASTIAQLVNKGVECVAIAVEPSVEPDDARACAEQYARRLHEIFGDQPDENCAVLLQALLKAEPEC